MDLRDYFIKAKEEKKAIGHFNFSTADQLRAFVEVAQELDLPVMVATSEGESEFVGYNQAAALVKSWQDQTGHPVFLNADHHKSWDTVKQAIDAGFDTVLIDGSKLPLEENIELTKKTVEYGRSKNPNMMIEGELGYLRGSSEIQDKIEISPDDFTKPEEAKEFVEKTGVDRLALAFGNVHGITTNQEMHLDLDLLSSIVEVVPTAYLVLHGGSGLLDEEVTEAIKRGITNVHVNTELRIAYHSALVEEFKKEPNQTTPYKFLRPSYEATKDMIRKKLKLFTNQ